MKPYYEHEGITIYHGDCKEIWHEVPREVDAIVTDPPYGINWNTDYSKLKGYGRNKKPNIGGKVWGKIHQDDEPFDPAFWLHYPKIIMFGYNHFANKLPTGTCLVWQKCEPSKTGNSFLSECELAWMKGGHGVYIQKKAHKHGECVSEYMHPTQKPVEIMQWCISKLKLESYQEILDPYMGSGTTLVAAKELGYKAIGIEIEEKYCEIAAKRLSQEVFKF